MSKDDPPANPLFSPSNNFNFASNALFMPVAEQTPALFSTAEAGEEEQFVGAGEVNAQPNEVPTFSAFSNTPAGDDPFSVVAQTSSAPEEPKLFVPSSPQPATFEAPGNNQMNLSGPPVGFESPPPPMPAANPYSHVAPGTRRHRPMFVPNPLINTSHNTSAPAPPNFPQPLAGPTPPVDSSPPTLPVDNIITSAAPPTLNPGPPPLNVGPPPLNQYPAAPPLNTAPLAPPTTAGYLQPVTPHWFYCKVLSDSNKVWCPFSFADSTALEKAYQQGDAMEAISTEGGRYDVDLVNMQRRSIYWDEAPSLVQRCTWFWKADNDNCFHPYEEEFCKVLEEEYMKATKENYWHKRINLPNGEVLALHGPQLVMHYIPLNKQDEFGTFSDQMKSNVVKRGISSTDFAHDVPHDEVGVPDHVVFFCHGIGSVCDLRKRSVVECVDDFRGIHQNLLRSHFKQSFESGKAKRIEFLPVHWHQALHGDATGVDNKIRRLTLPSISRLRHFTNETLLDILFYSSPVYCQTIAETVGNEINSLYHLFLQRNPNFNGKVSLAGHSLGSLILFDLLCHQSDQQRRVDAPPKLSKNLNSSNSLASSSKGSSHLTDATQPLQAHITTMQQVLDKLSLEKLTDKFEQEQVDLDSLLMCSEGDLKELEVPMGPRKKLMAFVKDHNEKAEREKEAKAWLDVAAETQVEQPTEPQPAFANLDPLITQATNVHVDFQQFDMGTGQPFVQYPQLNFKPQTLFAFGSPIGMFLTVRGIEELGEEFKFPTCDGFLNVFHPYDPVAYRVEPLINPDYEHKPILVPHHMGRKRMHLELAESIGRLGHDLKQGIMRSVRMAVSSVQRFAQQHWNQQEASSQQVEDEVRTMTEELLKQNGDSGEGDDSASITSDPQPSEGIGRLNGGKRIDYVLQERPLESFNNYLFAFQSHLCYWNNEDTVLLLMKDVYEKENVMSDQQLNRSNTNVTPPTLVASQTARPPLPPTTNINLG